MLRPVIYVTITQKGENRNRKLFVDFVNNYNFVDSWDKLTGTGKLILPKNIYVTDAVTLKRFPLFGVNKNIGGFNSEPIIKRGDEITIEQKYVYWDEDLNQKDTETPTIFSGYVAKVGAGMPIELEIENNMWLLKQIPMKNQSFKVGTSLESILTEALAGTNFTVNYLTSTTITFDNMLLSVNNETVAQFLARLRKDYFLYSYFRGNELRVGSLVYIEDEAKEKIFKFQENIIDGGDLKYNRKDDIVLSAVASNHVQELTGKTTKDGKAKTRNKRIEVLVTLKNDKVISKIVGKGEKPDPAVEGERRTFTFPFAKTNEELIKLATEQLQKYYYSGFKGSFTTFGFPFVVFGDNANIQNDILPEQNGIYKIKAVEYTGGIGGLRQKITLDYKLNL